MQSILDVEKSSGVWTDAPQRQMSAQQLGLQSPGAGAYILLLDLRQSKTWQTVIFRARVNHMHLVE